MSADEFVWLEFPATGGRARFAPAAVAAWTARGWTPCEPPAEPDPTKDPVAVLEDTAAVKPGKSKAAPKGASVEGSDQ